MVQLGTRIIESNQHMKDVIADMRDSLLRTKTGTVLDEQLEFAGNRLQAFLEKPNHCSVIVYGMTNSGKSSLINALLESPVCPMNEQPATANLLQIKHSPVPQCTLWNLDEPQEPVAEDVGTTTQILVEVNEDCRNTPDGAEPPRVNLRLDHSIPIFGSLDCDISIYDSPGSNEHGSARINSVWRSRILDADVILVVSDFTQNGTTVEHDLWSALAKENIDYRDAQIVTFCNKTDQSMDPMNPIAKSVIIDRVMGYTEGKIILKPENIFFGSARHGLMASCLLKYQKLDADHAEFEWLLQMATSVFRRKRNPFKSLDAVDREMDGPEEFLADSGIPQFSQALAAIILQNLSLRSCGPPLVASVLEDLASFCENYGIQIGRPKGPSSEHISAVFSRIKESQESFHEILDQWKVHYLDCRLRLRNRLLTMYRLRDSWVKLTERSLLGIKGMLLLGQIVGMRSWIAKESK
jgi:GTPase SAR1 family protein